MRVTVVGCAGSFAGPDSPSSCYLVQVPAAQSGEGRPWSVVLDLGNGAFGALQRYVDPFDVDAFAITHLHPDHFVDLCGLYVYRHYHPAGRPSGPVPVYGPSTTAERIGAAYGLAAGESMAGVLDVRHWPVGGVRVGPLLLETSRVNHPAESYGIRVTGPSGLGSGAAVLAYTGDTDTCDGVTRLSRDADLLLSEAAFQEGRDDEVRGIHLTGRRAGELARRSRARRLVLTHLPAWNDPAQALAEASGTYDGPIELARPGAVYEI